MDTQLNPNLGAASVDIPEFVEGSVEHMREQLFDSSVPSSLEASTDAWSELAAVFSSIPGDLRRITDQLLDGAESGDNAELHEHVDMLVAFGEDLASGLQYAANVVMPQAHEALNDAIFAAPYAQDSHDRPHPFMGPGSRALTDQEKLENWHDHGFECPHDEVEFCSLNPLYCDDFVQWNNEERYRDEYEAMRAALETVGGRYEELIVAWPAPEEPIALVPGASQHLEVSVGYAAWQQSQAEPTSATAATFQEQPTAAAPTYNEPAQSAGGLMGGVSNSTSASLGFTAGSDHSVVGPGTGVEEEYTGRGAPGIGGKGSSPSGLTGPGDLGEDLGGTSGSDSQEDPNAQPSNLERFRSGLDPTTRLEDGTLVLSPLFADQIPDETWRDMALQIPISEWEQMAAESSSNVAPQLAAHAPAHLFDQFPCNDEDFQPRTDDSGNPVPVGVNIPADSVPYVPSQLTSLAGSYDYDEALSMWKDQNWGDHPPDNLEILIDNPIGDPLLPFGDDNESPLGRPLQEDSDELHRLLSSAQRGLAGPASQVVANSRQSLLRPSAR